MKYQSCVFPRFFQEKYAAEFENLSHLQRESLQFKKFLEEIPVHVHAGDYFAGWYGYKELPEDYCAFKKRGDDNYFSRTLTEDEKIRDVLVKQYCYHIWGNDHGHVFADFAALLRRGTRAYLKDAEARLDCFDPASPEYAYLTAMAECLRHGEIFSLRFAEMAEERLKDETDPQVKERLEKIAAACRKLPMEPASDFYEALQSFMLLYQLIRISDTAWCSISMGSADQILYPYYCASKAQGVSDAEMEAMLLEIFEKLDTYDGQDCAMSIGGTDLAGNDLTNDLSWLILAAEKKNPYRSPLFSLRIHQGTPEALLEGAVSTSLFQKGQPTFYGDLACRQAVMGRGIDEATASRYQIHTCMSLALPGEAVDAAWGMVFNMHLPLELALNGGKPLAGELPVTLHTPPRTHYENIEEIYDQFRLYYRELFDICWHYCLKDTKNWRLAEPNPWLSALTADCIQRGKDRWDGGARYHDVIIEHFAFANAADALGAVEKLVFQEKKYTLDQLLQAARDNYQGHEQLRKEILSCPKYGMNIPAADLKAKRLLEIASDTCEEKKYDNIYFLPSLHTLDLDVGHAQNVHATLDGRLTGEPFNKNAGPTPLARLSGPTSVMMSACTLDQRRLSGGQALDIHFSARNVDDPVKRKKIAAMIRTYLLSGGLQLQVNALSAEALQKAYDHPEEYPHLIVRIGGHSRYFNELPDPVKKEFIHRIGLEEQAGG